MTDKWGGSDANIDLTEILNSSALYLTNPSGKSDEWLSSDAAIKSLNHNGMAKRIYDIGSLFPEHEDMINIGPYHNVSVLIKSEPDSESSMIALIPETQGIIDPKLLRVASTARNFEPKKPVSQDKSGYCSNCGTSETTLWRRTEGKLMCNPCALYFKLHGVSRPLHLLNGSIRRRRRRSLGKPQ